MAYRTTPSPDEVLVKLRIVASNRKLAQGPAMHHHAATVETGAGD
jgi:hypothetical protein